MATSSSYSTHADLPLGVATTHKCKSGDPCHCVTPKSRAPHPASSSAAIMSRIAELRPVLPRPSSGGPVHNPSTGIPHSHHVRHHENGLQPYKLAYGMTHQHTMQHQSYPSNDPSTSTFSFANQNYAEQLQMMGVDPWNLPPTDDVALDNLTFPSLCGCGDNCSCPGCFHHNRATATPSSSAYTSCTNPGACGTCLDCTILALPASAIPPADTALSIHNSDEPIAQWLRQMSTPDYSIQQGLDFQQQPASWARDPSFMPPYSADGSPFHRRRGSFSAQSHRPQSNIDPSLRPLMGGFQFLGLADPSRSRSPSASSQSSYQGSDGHGTSGPTPAYRPSGRVQGLYANTRGLQSAPQLNISRPGVNPGSTYASSNPDIDQQYDPSAATSLNLY